MRYTFERVDTATPERRAALLQDHPGWVSIDTTRPQFALLDDGEIADWPLIDSEAEAAKECAEFNRLPLHEDDARGELIWQFRRALEA